MSRSHANPPRTQDQQDDVDSGQLEDILGALHSSSNEIEALCLVKCSDHRTNNRPMEAATPYHKRSNNTSVPSETMTEEDKIVGLEARIPSYTPEMIKMKEHLTGTMEVKSQPLIKGEKRNDLGSDGSRISNKSSAT